MRQQRRPSYSTKKRLQYNMLRFSSLYAIGRDHVLHLIPFFNPILQGYLVINILHGKYKLFDCVIYTIDLYPKEIQKYIKTNSVATVGKLKGCCLGVVVPRRCAQLRCCALPLPPEKDITSARGCRVRIIRAPVYAGKDGSN